MHPIDLELLLVVLTTEYVPIKAFVISCIKLDNARAFHAQLHSRPQRSIVCFCTIIIDFPSLASNSEDQPLTTIHQLGLTLTTSATCCNTLSNPGDEGGVAACTLGARVEVVSNCGQEWRVA
jgi:hypothetical protein